MMSSMTSQCDPKPVFYIPLYMKLAKIVATSFIIVFIIIEFDIFSDTMEISQALVSAPLPSFSPFVQQQLSSSEGAVPERIFNMLTRECAQYYLSNWPAIGDQSHYKIIGEKMYRRYPCIALDGAHPWVSFWYEMSQRKVVSSDNLYFICFP